MLASFVLCSSAAQGLHDLPVLFSYSFSLSEAAFIDRVLLFSPGFCKASEDAWHWYIIASYASPGNINEVQFKMAPVYIAKKCYDIY